MANSKKRKKGRTGRILLLLLAVPLVAGFLLVRGEIAGGRKTGETVTVTIPQGSSTAAIARELKESGLIGNPMLFRLYTTLPPVAMTVRERRNLVTMPASTSINDSLVMASAIL